MIYILSKLSINKKRKKFSFFYTFLICGIIFLVFNRSIVYISFLPLLLFFIIKNDSKGKVGMFTVIFFYALLLFLFGQYSLFSKFTIWLKLLFNFSLRDKIFSFIENNYNCHIAKFINLVIFNCKDFETTLFYRKTIKLGIAWIICVSGFHLQLIQRIIRFITPQKNKIINKLLFDWRCDFCYNNVKN